MYLLKAHTSSIITKLAQGLGYDPTLLEPQIAQRAAWGDVAIPCFQLAKHLRISPQDLAQQFVDKITELQKTSHDLVSSLQSPGAQAIQGYLNLRFSPLWLWTQTVERALSLGEQWGRQPALGKTVLVESPSPNTNKPLHLGHVRNMLLGNAVANILNASGYTVVRTEVVNDRGIHICKSMLAYQKTAAGALPDKKSDHFVGDFYVAYSRYLAEHPEAEEEIAHMLQLREQGDPDVRALWAQMNTRALEGFAESYKRFGVDIQARYLESEHYEAGKQLVLDAYKKGIFTKNDKGNIVANLEDNNLGDKVLLRADGTSIYITQDIALAEIRNRDYEVDGMIYVVGNEQEDHFKALFALLKKLGFSRADRCHHLSYGMIRLPDGKMKSREGNVVDADTLADDMHRNAYELLQQRYPDLTDVELHERAEAIALGAITFFMLKYEAAKDFVFDVQSSLSFEGETGPYIQYTAARCAALLRTSKHTSSPAGVADRAAVVAQSDSDKERHVLIDFLLHGKRHERYTPSQEALLYHKATDAMDTTIKPLLNTYRSLPLLSENPFLPDHTDRIVHLEHPTGTSAYLLSQHTPQIHAEPRKQRRKTGDIRYSLHPTLDDLAAHISSHASQSREKIHIWQTLLDLLPETYEDMQRISSPGTKKTLGETLTQRIIMHPGSTETDLRLQQKIERLSSPSLSTNIPAQRALLISLRDLLVHSRKERQRMIDHLEAHLDAIERTRLASVS